MPDDITPSGIGSLLSTLRTLPVWLLTGLALGAFSILFSPAFGGVDPIPFRSKWGIWVWIVALTFSGLAITRAVDSGVAAYRAHRRLQDASRSLRLIPLHHQCWWHLAKQQDDTFVSQIHLDIGAANLTDRSVRIVKANLLRPRTRGEFIHSDIALPLAGSPYHSTRHPVPPHDNVTASVNMMVRGSLARQGRPLRASFQFTDQLGDEYRVKRIVLKTHDPIPPSLPLAQRLASVLGKVPGLRQIARRRSQDDQSPPAEWQHDGAFDEVDLILDEEKRSYAARGRRVGALGSLNVGVQSEPGFGGTAQGEIPVLLWDKDKGKRVDSPNVGRLIALRAVLDVPSKDNLERYLLSHLHKDSRYAEQAYLVFLALHRMDRTVEALRSARSRLAGDKVCGYSNLLATLSALISHEHFEIGPTLYPQLQKVLAGDTEHNFRLSEKITLARLRHLDSELGEPTSTASQTEAPPSPPNLKS
ncbi:MAG: hypothetical protein WB919_04680 [Candidatus Sulfotelmatobacter sp.]